MFISFIFLHWVLVAVDGIFVVSFRIFYCGLRPPVGSQVAVQGLSSPLVCVILVSQLGIKPLFLELQGTFFTTGPQGKSQYGHLNNIKSSNPWM